MWGNNIYHTLSHTAAFAGLPQEAIKRFYMIGQKRIFQAQEIVIKEGQWESALYIILTGQFQVFLPQHIAGKHVQRFTYVQLNTLHAGDCFGEYSLIDDKPASASVIATQTSELLQISKTDFDAIVNTNDRIARTIYYNLLQIVIERIRKKEQEYDLILAVT